MSGDDLKESPVTKDEAEMTRKLHEYIRSGDIASTKSLIQNLSMEVRRKLTRPIQELGLKPAIFIAIEKGRIKFVKFLVNDCGADINEEACCTIEEKDDLKAVYETGPRDMTPLEFALFMDRPQIKEFLLSVGADVTKVAKNDNALLKACEAGPDKLAELLADNGANVNGSSIYGVTCLMNSVRSSSLCRFLLDKGARVDSETVSGQTALHIAASSNKHECVRVLLERGANPFSQNNEGDDVLRTASLYENRNTANFLLKTVFKDVKRQIESYQILGTTFVEVGSFRKALSLWKKAITLASENQIQTVATKLETPFGIAVEATSLAEINKIRLNPDDVNMQSIVLSYKHLGPTHSVFQRVIFSVALRYFDTQSFEKCWRLLTYCIRITPNSTLRLSKRCELLQSIFIQTELYMVELCERRVRPSIDFAVAYEFMETIKQAAIKRTEPEESAIFMHLIFNGIFLLSLMDCQKREKFEFQKLVHAVLKADRKSEKGKSILLEALDLDDNFENSPFRFPPYLNVISTLLECGSDISERDENGNNAVHLWVNTFIKNGKRGKYHFRKIAAKLVEYGVHLDARNDKRIQATSCLQELGIKIAPPINLMCSAARAIRRFNISLQSLEKLLPKFLVDFVEMH